MTLVTTPREKGWLRLAQLKKPGFFRKRTLNFWKVLGPWMHPNFRRSLPWISAGVILLLGQPTWARTPPAMKRAIQEVSRAVEALTIQAPRDQEVCFSPDEPCDLKLIKFIQSAQKSLDIAIYDINLDQLVHHVILKSKTIPVRVIADRRQSKGDHSLVPLLIRSGVNLRFGKQRGIFHNKFAIVDGLMLETGSFNYTNHAARANSENQIYLRQPEIVKKYQDFFERSWNRATPAASVSSRPSP